MNNTETFIALLRGINVGGHNKVPMAALRELCTALGWSDVKTYIQSGNLVFRVWDGKSDLEDALEDALVNDLGVSSTVIVRRFEAWLTDVKRIPFPKDVLEDAGKVSLGLAKAPPARGCEKRLLDYVSHGERIVRRGDALWFHFRHGVAKTKLTTAVIEREAGTPVTLRNWRTVSKLTEMAGALAGDQ